MTLVCIPEATAFSALFHHQVGMLSTTFSTENVSERTPGNTRFTPMGFDFYSAEKTGLQCLPSLRKPSSSCARAGGRRGVQRAADQGPLHGPGGRAHLSAAAVRQQGRALPRRGESGPSSLLPLCFSEVCVKRGGRDTVPALLPQLTQAPVETIPNWQPMRGGCHPQPLPPCDFL